MSNEEMINVNVRMPLRIRNDLAEKAKKEDRSLSNYLLRVVQTHYEKVKK